MSDDGTEREISSVEPLSRTQAVSGGPLSERFLVLAKAAGVIEAASTTEAVLAELRNVFTSFGSDRRLLTGVPMPSKPIEPLILENRWAVSEKERRGRSGGGPILTPSPDDLVIQKAVDWPLPFVLRDRFFAQSPLAQAADLPRTGVELLIVPVISVPKFQGVLVTTFTRDPSFASEIAERSLPRAELEMMGIVGNLAFRRLAEIKALPAARDGELTPREREVVALTALGETAHTAAEKIGVSERTVVAHLKNAMEKLNASNKPECVIQAIRYRQIGPGAGYGFYQMATEIFGAEGYDYKKVFE